MDENIFRELNPQQREAVVYHDGPLIILAGAGSGKTRVLIQKVAYLITCLKIPPHEILMITFTNKAADEMKSRIGHTLHDLGLPSKSQMSKPIGFVGTFHSFCAKVLREYGDRMGLRSDYVIYTDQDQESLIKQILKRVDGGRMTPGYFMNKISEAKNQLIKPEDYLQTFSYFKSAQVAEVYFEYQKELTTYHAVDFDDLIMHVVNLFRTHREILDVFHRRFSHIMVDEFQDTNVAQYTLTKLLAPESRQITTVGDFSQAIYSWRGADIRNLERFSKDFPNAKILYLEQNYRSTQQILDYAYSKIIENQTHPILKLFTNAEQGDAIVEYEAENEEYEALYVAKKIAEDISVASSESQMKPIDEYARYAVLYRTNAQSRVLEEVFLKFGIPYTLFGGTRFYDRKEVRDVLAYLRLIVQPDDPVAIDRVKKLGKRRFDKFVAALPDLQIYAVNASAEMILDLTLAKTNYLDMFDKEDPEEYARIENIRELKNVAASQETLTNFFEQIALIENEYSVGERTKQKGKGVRLMSLHASKGLEFDVVFIVGLEDGILPHARSLDDSYAMEEERRLFYVGITRARKLLHIVWARRRGMYGRNTYGIKSRFIASDSEGKSNPVSDAYQPGCNGDDWDW